MDLHDTASCGFTATVFSDHSYFFSSWPLDEKWTDLFSERQINPSFF
jgi:hypothetical protein